MTSKTIRDRYVQIERAQCKHNEYQVGYKGGWCQCKHNAMDTNFILKVSSQLIFLSY